MNDKDFYILGHGPLSHLWEQFVKEARAKKGILSPYHHEETSIVMLEKYDLKKSRKYFVWFLL